MNHTAEDDPVTVALEKALAAAGTVEPPAGLESRVLARLRQAADAPAPPRRRLAAAFVALAAAVTLAVLLPRFYRRPAGRSAQTAALASVARSAPKQAMAASKVRRARKAVPRARTGPVSLDLSAARSRAAARRRPEADSSLRAANATASGRRFPQQFPTPMPPTPQERALQHFLLTASPSEISALFSGPSTAPLQVKALVVPPIVPPAAPAPTSITPASQAESPTGGTSR